MAPDEGEVADRPTSGQLNAALARTVVRTHSRYLGRGPTRAHAFFRHNIVVVVLEDTLTTAERTLADDGNEAAVAYGRRQVERAMRSALIAAVEDLTGCSVTAFMSDSHVKPDLAAEIYVLDRSVPCADLAPSRRRGAPQA